MSDDKLAELLATYLTGSNVAAASIGLELGGHAGTLAEPFFALRSALGVNGYATRDEAIAALQSECASMEGEIERLWAENEQRTHRAATDRELGFSSGVAFTLRQLRPALTPSKTGEAGAPEA